MGAHLPLSLLVFFGLFGVLMIYDLVIITKRGYSATVSATLYAFTKAFPIIGIIFGVLIGHLFWPNLSACHTDLTPQAEPSHAVDKQ
jgi:hypothetical protein